YEYLPAIGTIIGIILGLIKLFGRRRADRESEAEGQSEANDPMFVLFFALMTWWTIATIVTLSIAGERMPWLTLHMAWPMILFTGWAVGQIIEAVTPQLAEYKPQQAILSFFVLAIFLLE